MVFRIEYCVSTINIQYKNYCKKMYFTLGKREICGHIQLLVKNKYEGKKNHSKTKINYLSCLISILKTRIRKIEIKLYWNVVKHRANKRLRVYFISCSNTSEHNFSLLYFCFKKKMNSFFVCYLIEMNIQFHLYLRFIL